MTKYWKIFLALLGVVWGFIMRRIGKKEEKKKVEYEATVKSIKRRKNEIEQEIKFGVKNKEELIEETERLKRIEDDIKNRIDSVGDPNDDIDDLQERIRKEGGLQ